MNGPGDRRWESQGSFEKRLVQLLIQEGMVSEAMVRDAEQETRVSGPVMAEGERRWGAVVSRLLERGLVREEALEPILVKLAEEGFSTDVLPSVALPPSASAAPSRNEGTSDTPPIPGWERYQISAFLGDGGMGQVYKAFDPRLKRFVAVKFVRGNDPSFQARLLQEAQAQAKISHDNVCRIYEVGEERGVPFIAMQFIDGVTLHEARYKMTTDQKVVVVKKAAEALHEAHRLGLVHRDVKPGNIMVEATEDGGWRPYVMDFGLAREVESPGMTATGAILGTPAYLSPEQASGRGTLDRRCDVYSLGATFYDLLTGQPPFEGGTIDVLLKLTAEEPVPPRRIDPRIPQDLETVVLKCLEKEPQRRYESARALAEDLGRYLDGEPVLARRPSLSYRLSKRVRKHKALVAVVAVALAALILLAGWGIHARREASAQTRMAQTFGQEVERVQGTLEKARLLPLHDTRPEKALVKTRMDWIERQMGEVGPVSFGPGHYALARGFMSLGDNRKALEHLELAWSKFRYQTPEVAQSLGLALAMIYQDELDEAERIGNKERREKKLKEIEKRYRTPALEYLGKGGGSGAEAGGLAQAMLAYLDKDYEGAIRKARLVSTTAPWLYEAEMMEGNIHTLRGVEANTAGRYDEAVKSYAQAEEAFQRALQKGRSDANLYRVLGRLYESLMVVQVYGTGQSPKE